MFCLKESVAVTLKTLTYFLSVVEWISFIQEVFSIDGEVGSQLRSVVDLRMIYWCKYAVNGFMLWTVFSPVFFWRRSCRGILT